MGPTSSKAEINKCRTSCSEKITILVLEQLEALTEDFLDLFFTKIILVAMAFIRDQYQLRVIKEAEMKDELK